MGDILTPQPVWPVLVLFSRYEGALRWGLEQGKKLWGAEVLSSRAFPFDQTSYYEGAMGPGLLKSLHVFPTFHDPAPLADWKLQTNRWEEEYAATHPGNEQPCDEPRPLNLDPGYLTPAKLLLASTKDHAHRIYLRDGIYAEITLYFRSGGWQPGPWTFPDFRTEEYQSFFADCRTKLRLALKHRSQSS